MMSNLVVSAEGLRNYILEGVDNLRIRKCRPDRETIAHYVLRKYGGSLNDIFNELENIVDEGLLLKVEYKGSTSYRTPQSFDQKNSPLLTKHSKILNSTRTTRLILTTINELLVQNPDYCVQGIPLAELKTKLRDQEPVRFADDKLDTAFSREVSIGNVLLGDGGRVYPKDIQPKKNQTSNNSANGGKGANGSKQATPDQKVPKKRGRKSNAEKAAIAAAAAAASSGGEAPPEVKVESPAALGEAKIEEKVAEAVRKTFDGRVSGRHKIKRKVFDPSDVPSPNTAKAVVTGGQAKKKKRSSSSQESPEVCEICGKKGDLKKLISCSSCSTRCHIICGGIDKEKHSSSSNGEISDWLCKECIICNACSSPLKSSSSVECGKCKSSFHALCVGDGKDFMCGECVFNADDSPKAKTNATTPKTAVKRKGTRRPPKNRKSEENELEAKSPNSSAEIPPTVKSEEQESEEEKNTSVEAAHPETTEPSGRVAGDDSSEKSPIPEPCVTESEDNELDSQKKCSEWTPKDVEAFFKDKGLPDAGAMFREQEVDGLSLLLMKRSDVIFGLRLRLGPALKVYKLILQLQNATEET